MASIDSFLDNLSTLTKGEQNLCKVLIREGCFEIHNLQRYLDGGGEDALFLHELAGIRIETLDSIILSVLLCDYDLVLNLDIPDLALECLPKPECKLSLTIIKSKAELTQPVDGLVFDLTNVDHVMTNAISILLQVSTRQSTEITSLVPIGSFVGQISFKEEAKVTIIGKIDESVHLLVDYLNEYFLATKWDHKLFELIFVDLLDSGANMFTDSTEFGDFAFFHKNRSDLISECNKTETFLEGYVNEINAICAANADILTNTDALQKSYPHIENILLYESKKSGKNTTKLEIMHRKKRRLPACFPSGTMVATRTGNYPIETLCNKTVEIWNGDVWEKVDNFRQTGKNKPLLTLYFSNGFQVTATADHDFILNNGTKVKMSDLSVGDCLKDSRLPRSTVGKKFDADNLKRFYMGYMIPPNFETSEFKITKIVDSGISEDVYCCTVESNGCFALGNGLLVGNCSDKSGYNYIAPVLHIQPDKSNLPSNTLLELGNKLIQGIMKIPLIYELLNTSRELNPMFSIKLEKKTTKKLPEKRKQSKKDRKPMKKRKKCPTDEFLDFFTKVEPEKLIINNLSD